MLWNPLTTEYKRLSKPTNPDHIECYNGRGYRLYYSSCEDDYKLLVVTNCDNVYIYSLKSDSWRKLNKKAPFFQEACFLDGGFYLRENIYFQHPKIAGLIRFDTTAERFHKIETPHNNKPHSTAITVRKGSIHLCVKYNIKARRTGFRKTCIELWKFNANEDISSKVVTYHLRHNDDIRDMCPVHLMSNGNWLMKDYKGKVRICQVELTKKYTKYKDSHDEYKLYDYKVEGYTQEVKYTATFVSPNQYMK